MRIDKYLKVSRLIKRRTIAAEACAQGRVYLNDKQAKASAEVKLGDKLKLLFGQKELELEVLSIAEHAKKDDASSFYRVLSEKIHAEQN